MIELSRYIYEHYPNIKSKIQYWKLLSLLDKNEDKIIMVMGNNKILGTALYAKISDENLWKIEYGFLNLTKPEDVKVILEDNGENIHFLYLLAKSFLIIKKGLSEVIKKENPKTVSWFSPDMKKLNKFELKRSLLCQSH